MTNGSIKKWEPNLKSQFSLGQIASGLVLGAILGIAGTLFAVGQRVAALEEYASELKQKNSQQAAAQNTAPAVASPGAELVQSPPAPSLPDHDDVRPEKLLDFVKEQQRIHVKPSYGEAAFQAFTDVDLDQFIKDDVPGQIAQSLKHDNMFISVILALKQLPPGQRQALLRSCDKPLHQTWAQLGRITPEGQTDAGQRAEVLVADAIVNLTKDLLHLSPDALKAKRSCDGVLDC